MQAQNGAGSSQVVQQVIDSQVDQLLDSQSLQHYNEAYITGHGSTSLRHTAAGAEMLLLLQPKEKQQSVKILLDTQAVSKQPGRQLHLSDATILHYTSHCSSSSSNGSSRRACVLAGLCALARHMCLKVISWLDVPVKSHLL